MRKVIPLFLGALISLPTVASAEKERKSPLTDAPVIRRRLELRDKRFEIGAGAGVTIGQDFYNALLVQPKLAYHITDWLSLAALGGFNLTPGWKSSFHKDLNGALPPEPDPNTGIETASLKTPYADEAPHTMNRISYFFIGQIEFIPLAGKIALLSSLFSYFDFYILGGAGVVSLAGTGAAAPTCPPPPTTNPHPCHPPGAVYTKTELAFSGGLGAHAFLNRWLALNLEFHDLIYKNNASGRDVNGDKLADSRDLQWMNNYIFSLNFQVFMPFKTKISR
jgi:outer membrane beta-barrel protein